MVMLMVMVEEMVVMVIMTVIRADGDVLWPLINVVLVILDDL